MGLIFEPKEAINRWISSQGGGIAPEGYYTALGYVQDGRIVGGITYSNFNGAHCIANIALEGGVFPRALLRAGLFYPFNQLSLKRLTFFVSESNIRSQRLVEGLGARLEATLRDADPSGKLLIYALFPEDCVIWRRLRERLGKRTAST